MTSLAGGVGLIIIAAIAIFYSDRWLLRFVSAAVLLILLGTQAALALDDRGSSEHFYWSRGRAGVNWIICRGRA
jgi:hypothetical protein